MRNTSRGFSKTRANYSEILITGDLHSLAAAPQLNSAVCTPSDGAIHTLLYLLGVQIWNACLKDTVNSVEWEKIALFKACSIDCYMFFPSSGRLMNTMPVKIFPFFREPFIEPYS